MRAAPSLLLAVMALSAGCRDLTIADRDLGLPQAGDLSLIRALPDGIVLDATVLVGLDPQMDFMPPTVSIAAGGSVTWIVRAGTHSFVSDSVPAAWDPTDAQMNGAHGQVFATPGTFPYHCGVHPTQTGTIIVVR